MLEINARITNREIFNSNICISKEIPERTETYTECRSKFRASKIDGRKMILLSVELDVDTKEKSLQANFVAEFMFELDFWPSDYNAAAEQILIPQARASLLKTMDEMLELMGQDKIRLTDQI